MIVREPQYNPGLHCIAWLTLLATFPLIFMGGLVTSHGAGMSVPDWPNSYGYNMFLFPPRLWIGGILYEHTHRLMGTVVGLCSIVLMAWAWITEARRWVCWLCTAVLGAVIIQGVLGGLRVVLIKLDLAIVHACFAQAFFCLVAFTVTVTSRWWLFAPNLSDNRATNGGRTIVRLAVIAVMAIYLQLIIGAVMRHYQAGLAILDVPLTYGKVLPPLDDRALTEVNQARASVYKAWVAGVDARTPLEVVQQIAAPVTFRQIWIHFAHRVGALLVSFAVGSLIVYTLARHRAGKLVWPAIALSLLLVTQVTLGIFTVLLRKPADIASLHVAVGALTLMTTFVLLVRSIRMYQPRRTAIGSAFEVLPASDTCPVYHRPAAV